MTGITFLVAPILGKLYHNPQITDLVRWLSLVFVFNSFNRVQNTILNKELNFKKLTIRTFIASVLSGGLGIWAAYEEWGVYSLVIQTLSFGFFSSIFLWTTTSWKPSLHFSMDEVRKLMGFSMYAFFERILNNVFNRLDVLLLARIFSPVTVGFYTRASTLVDQVTKYSASSIIRVLFPVLSKVQDDQETYSRIYFRMFSIIAFLSYALSGILYFLGADLIVLLFGKKWEFSIPIFQILVIASCNIPLNSLMWNAMMSKGKAKENFYFGSIKKLIGLIPFLVAFYTNVWWFTVTWVASKFIITILNIFMLKRHSDLSVRKHFYHLISGFALLIPGLVFFEWLDLKLFATRIAYTIVYFAVYLSVNRLIKNQGLMYVLSMVKDIQTVIGRKLVSNQ